MMRSMFSGISGLRSHQVMMDVVGNNIANVNTQGFKASMVTFQEALSQLIQAPGASGGGSGGSNPLQVGLGVEVGAIDGIFTQGASQVTGRNTDVAIQGAGFFVVEEAGERYFTRAGTFNFDADGNLTTPGGQIVQGWVTDPTTGLTDTQAPVSALSMPLAQVIDPIETTEVVIGGNLPADLLVGDSSSVSISVYDMEDRGKLVWERRVGQILFPRNSGIPAADKSIQVFQRQFVEVVAEQVAVHFYKHDPNATFALDAVANQ